MQALDEEYDEMNGALTNTLIRSILESRRALRAAVSMLEEMMRTGTTMEWSDDVTLPAAERRTELPARRIRPGPVARSKRKSTHHPPLRLVTPLHHDSPLVLPGDSRRKEADEPARDHRQDEKRPSRRENAVMDA